MIAASAPSRAGRDPTSHNLWPLSLLLVALVGLGWLALLALLRRFLLPRPDTAGGR